MTEGVELAKVIAGAPHSPVVYFLRVSGNVKIGTSTRLLGRIRALSLSLADVALIVPGDADLERAYHQRFARQRLRDSEWFRIESELLTFLTRHAPPIVAQGLEVDSEPEPLPGDAVGLRLAVKARILTISLQAARRARADDVRFPRPVGNRGPEFLYDPAALTSWELHRPRGSEPRTQ